MIRRSWTQAASFEETLALWAASLREIKKRIRPLFTQERVATNAGLFLEGLLGDEQRKTLAVFVIQMITTEVVCQSNARSWAERRPNSSARHGGGISAARMRCQAWPILTIHSSSRLVLRIHWRRPQHGGTPAGPASS